jgi:extradiol dioxygenase family protein
MGEVPRVVRCCTRGVTVDGEIVRRWGALGDGQSLDVRDPDGNAVELKTY